MDDLERLAAQVEMARRPHRKGERGMTERDWYIHVCEVHPDEQLHSGLCSRCGDAYIHIGAPIVRVVPGTDLVAVWRLAEARGRQADIAAELCDEARADLESERKAR